MSIMSRMQNSMEHGLCPRGAYFSASGENSHSQGRKKKKSHVPRDRKFLFDPPTTFIENTNFS